MARLNHEKANLLKRVAQEYRDERSPSGSKGCFQNRKGWLKILFGKYRGMTLPTIFFRDPSYFFREIIWKKRIAEQSEYGKRLAIQARTIGYRARYIRPPHSSEKFAICYTHDGVFRRLKVIRNRPAELALLKKKYGSARIKHILDVQALYWKLTTGVQRERLVRDLVRIFLSGEPDRISSTDCGRFFDDADNFDIG